MKKPKRTNDEEKIEPEELNRMIKNSYTMAKETYEDKLKKIEKVLEEKKKDKEKLKINEEIKEEYELLSSALNIITQFYNKVIENPDKYVGLDIYEFQTTYLEYVSFISLEEIAWSIAKTNKSNKKKEIEQIRGWIQDHKSKLLDWFQEYHIDKKIR